MHKRAMKWALAAGLLCAPVVAQAQGQDKPTLESALAQIQTLTGQIEALEKRLSLLEGSSADTTEEEALAELKAELEALKAQLGEVAAQATEASERLTGVEDALAGEHDEEVFAIGFDGFLRTEFVAIQDDRDRSSFIGLNDGFGQGNARFRTFGSFGDVTFQLSLEGATDRRNARNTASGEVRTELRDAFFEYGRWEFARIRLGQFKPPHDMEEWRSTNDILFVSRALESRGVRGVEGVAVSGLSLDRQVGMMVYSDPIPVADTGIAGAYYLSVANGNNANQPVNDNDQVAVYGRVELHYDSMLILGAAGYFNERTTGELADLINEERIGVAADLSFNYRGILFNAQFMHQISDFPQVEVQEAQTAQGFHFEVGYDIHQLGLVPAYRIAFLDPTASFESTEANVDAQLEIDEQTHHTFGVTWRVPDTPIKLQANYTLTIEDPNRVFNNDRLELLGHMSF